MYSLYVVDFSIGGTNLDNIELKTVGAREVEAIEQSILGRYPAIEALLRSIPTVDFDKEEGLQETPRRVAKMYEELFCGYEMDPEKILAKRFSVEGEPSEIWVRDIPFYSTCEHHLMPFFGTVDVMYQPPKGGSVVGLSKIARLVEAYARRLQIQERMGNQIKDAIVKYLLPFKAMVCIKATHTCMTARGIEKIGSVTETISVHNIRSGVEEEKTKTRDILNNMISVQQSLRNMCRR